MTSFFQEINLAMEKNTKPFIWNMQIAQKRVSFFGIISANNNITYLIK